MDSNGIVWKIKMYLNQIVSVMGKILAIGKILVKIQATCKMLVKMKP